jgi:hypothetical protein
MRQLIRREKEWTADAYRLEGQASALEGVVAQLVRVAGDPAGADAAGAGPEAQAPVAIGSDAGSANARGAIER